ncbi:biliverdin-producing heme oxygenase [Homoserinibacter sp. YIM 151385]|uniref:biliverdin-producing heme oxygenase n=1 Tax=Homoserinibacter sp. YIM 151385 TaxID=2985506 RepID=UPI0022F08E1B|nr:biliverdin-producing heme oxygenase [Homoserinibacter sp. YIM 151385]WBU37063.1 biliverdin-producing heme oxygenase [Homoserinibacter sp. YIM 151385]
MSETTQPEPFSARLRARTWSGHETSEGATFMAELLDGTRGAEDYAALAAQHLHIYRAIEETGRLAAVRLPLGGLLDPALERVPSIVADLRHLGVDPDGDDGILAALPATAEYAARVRQTASEPVAYLAHHFTRYLGDLSGGQIIRTLLQRRFGYEADGVRFYRFEGIEKPKAYKDEYRTRLDALAETWSGEEQETMIAEVLRAYAFNTAVFGDLARAHVLA